MSAKAAPQIQKSATPAPPVSAPLGLANVRAFTDETAVQEQESSTAEWEVAAAAAAAPPPEESTHEQGNTGYNFGQISVTDYVPATVQTKLVVGAPGDKYEQEADAMADRVLSMTTSVQRQAESPEAEAQIPTPSITETAENTEQDGTVHLKPLAETVQRQTEEDGTVHLKPLAETVQRQTEEDGTVHLKPLAETVQRQTEEDGTVHLKPLAETVQRQTEEDGTVHLKPLAETVQRQTEEDGTVHLKPLANQISPAVQGKIKNSTLVARKENGAFTASDSIESRIKSGKGSGQGLPDETRDFMESRFGNDFSGVKVHTGSEAVQLNKELGAQAFTHGEDIYFNSGKYSPHNDDGKKLLAHELTHTIQQTGPKVHKKSLKSAEKAKKIQRQSSTLPKSVGVLSQISPLKGAGKIQQEPTDKNKDKKAAEGSEKGNDNQPKNNQQNNNPGQKGEGEQGQTDTAKTPKPDAAGADSGEAQAENGDKADAVDVGDTGTVGMGDTGAGGGEEAAPSGEAFAPVAVSPDPDRPAPDSPDADPAFQAVLNQAQAVTGQYSQHPTAEAKASEAQQAAEDPQKQMREAQATQIEKTGHQETKAFDRKVFEQAILDKVGIAVPSNLKEADEFSKNNKLGEVKNQLTQQVEQNKEQAAGGLPAANKAAPDPSGEESKPVTPIPDIAEDVGKQQPTIEADKAVPKEKSNKEIENPLEQTAENLDNTFGEIQTKLTVGAPGDKYEQEADQMADRVMAMSDPEPGQAEELAHPEAESAPHVHSQIQNQLEPTEDAQYSQAAPDIADEQLLAQTVQRVQLFIQRKVAMEAQSVDQPTKEVPLNMGRLETWGEMGGSQAIDALKEAKSHSTEGPKEYRQEEQTQLTTDQGAAVATADNSNQEMFATRSENMTEVADVQEQTKTEDEQQRAKITADVDKIYEKTKADVDARLQKLDEEVNREFEQGSQAAKQKFEGYVALRMMAYKAERYGGILGSGKWIKDQFLGIPDEVNKFYEEGKQVYIDEMKKSISTISTLVETGLNEAKARVDSGKQEVTEYVQSLAEDLKQIGAEAAFNIQSKFENLEQSVREKQNQLVESLSQKYQESLKELDQRIEKLQEENKGLVDKALKAIGDVAKAIIKAILTPIKNILQGLIGEEAGKVIDAIIEDPLKFMKNLFQGIGDGIKKFASNIGKHLLNGLVSWLFGNIGGELKLPEKFDVKGFLDVLLQVLGLTKDYIFGIAEQFLGTTVVDLIKFLIDFIMQNGADSLKVLWDLVKVIATVGVQTILLLIEQGVEAIESLPDSVKSVFQSLGSGIEMVLKFAGTLIGSLGEGVLQLVGGLGKGAQLIFDFFRALFKDGIVGIWEFIKSSLGTIKDIFMKSLSEMVIVEVVKQGVIWLISMLNPASGIAKIAKAIYDVINFIMEKKEQIKALVDAVLTTLKAIIQGNPGVMAEMIENSLSNAIPQVLSFLAALLGIGGIPAKIQKIFVKLKEPVTKIVSGVFQKVKGFFKSIGSAVKKGYNKVKKGVKKAYNKVKKSVKKAYNKAKGKVKSALGIKDKNKSKDNAKKRIKAAFNETQGMAKNVRAPEEVDKKLPGIASKHKLDKLKLKKHKNTKYKIEGQTKQIKAQRQAEPGARMNPSGRVMLAQLKGENPWKNPKTKVKVSKEKLNGDKTKADFTLKVELLDDNTVLKKVAKEIKTLVNKKLYASQVEGKLSTLQKKFELKSLKLNKNKADGTVYEIIAESGADKSTSAQREAMPGAGGEMETAGIEAAIQRSQGKGQELAPTVRAPMEDAFGFDFTRVRIHADTEGDRLSRSLEARAFTTGSDIFFRQGAYKPESPSGQRLLAHELTHVVQQSGESMPVNSGNSFFSHTAQRVSEEAPHFVQRQADTSAETKEKIAKNKVTLQVSVKKQAPQTEEQKKKAPAVQEQVLPDEVVYDLVGLIQQIVNQNPNADIVQKKLDAVRAEYGLKALQVVGNATMGDSFTYDIRMKGPVEKPDTSSKDVAEGVKSMGSGGTLLDLALDYAIGYAVDKAVDGVTGLFKSNKKKSKSSSKKQSDQKTASQDKKAEANPGETQEESKPEQTEKKPKAEPEKKVPEAEQTTDPAADQSKQKGTKAQKPLDVNTKINRIDPVTVEVSVRANPKQGKTDPNSEQK